MATDKEVEKKRKDVEALRLKIAEEQTKIATNTHEAENDLVLAQLTAEENRLQAEYDQVHALANKSNLKASVKEQTSQILDGPEAADLEGQTAIAEGK